MGNHQLILIILASILADPDSFEEHMHRVEKAGLPNHITKKYLSNLGLNSPDTDLYLFMFNLLGLIDENGVPQESLISINSTNRSLGALITDKLKEHSATLFHSPATGNGSHRKASAQQNTSNGAGSNSTQHQDFIQEILDGEYSIHHSNKGGNGHYDKGFLHDVSKSGDTAAEEIEKPMHEASLSLREAELAHLKVQERLLIKVLYQKAELLKKLNRNHEALAAFDEIINRDKRSGQRSLENKKEQGRIDKAEVLAIFEKWPY